MEASLTSQPSRHYSPEKGMTQVNSHESESDIQVGILRTQSKCYKYPDCADANQPIFDICLRGHFLYKRNTKSE